MVSGLTSVTGGSELYVNCYVRSNMKNVYMGVTEYDSGQSVVAQTAGTTFTPSGWSMNNYLQRTGTWSVSLDSATRYVIVSIGATCQSNPSYLDVDCVSAWEGP